MEFLLTDVKEVDENLANFLFENGFDDCTPYSSDGKSFLSLDDEDPQKRLLQLAKLGIKAVLWKEERDEQ